MQPDRFAPDDAREWLNRAKSSLAKARGAVSIPGVYLEDVCFDAQQAAEKAIKAVLLSVHRDFPYTHDLVELITVAERIGIVVPEAVLGATRLSDYAVETRYPGVWEPVTWEEYEQAAATAEAVVEWAESLILGGG